MKLIPVVLSGGAGTRLWPVSREGHPKPFMKLADGETLIEKTYRRAVKLPGVVISKGKPKILTVTNRDYYFMTRDELQKTGATGSFMLEPCGRNTAPAIAMAAHRIKDKFGPDALMLVLSADHLIQDEVAFAEAVQKACQLAQTDEGFLVTFGIVPNGPETGFGYIKAGGELAGCFQVEAFVEKPDAPTAQKYVDSGNYYWNSGMFCFSAGQLLNQLSMYAPDVAKICTNAWSSMKDLATDDADMMEIPESLFSGVPNISIDYALMERSNKVAVVPSDIGWSDIGSWSAIRDLVEPDSQNNRAYGDAVFVNSRNTFVQSEDRLVAAVGLDNVMIVDTPDALLVANPACAQDVKTVVSILKKADHDTFKLHKTVCRPWGTYTVLEEGPEFKMKRIEVKPGGRLSLQMHRHRSEHWVVVKGQAIVVNGEEELVINQNESTYIPAGHKHRLENRTEGELVLIEVQCGGYLGEDDIVRFEDNYGRA
jgi:mannose-1-phosphate guanylyltransferase / mannose-6-phosphate isomerase